MEIRWFENNSITIIRGNFFCLIITGYNAIVLKDYPDSYRLNILAQYDELTNIKILTTFQKVRYIQFPNGL